MNIAGVLAHINQVRGTSYRLIGAYNQGESGTASQVIDADTNRYVLKIGAGSEFRAERAARATKRLRDRGYPAPEYVAVGKLDSISYTLQRVLPGEPIGPRISLDLLPQLLHLNDLQRDQGDCEYDEPERLIRGVMEGYADFCVLETLRTYSAESARILDSLQRVVGARAKECPQRNDIVHFDFHTNNVLMADGLITGVIDWEGCASGDCAFDLATMLFYCWRFQDVRVELWRALLEWTTSGAAAIYLAHMMVRQLDWSIRHHVPETVEDYLNDAREIARAIEQL